MWRVSEHIEDREVGAPTFHEASDDAVDALVALVRGHLTAAKAEAEVETFHDLGLEGVAEKWFSSETVAVLKRYLDGVEGTGYALDAEHSTLRQDIGAWRFVLSIMHPLDEVTVEFAGEGE